MQQKTTTVFNVFRPGTSYAPISNSVLKRALQVARLLRKAGKSVDVYAEAPKKVAKAFNYADRAGAERIAFVAPDEWSKGLVRIKDLRNFKATDPDDLKQKDVPIDDLGKVDSYFGGQVFVWALGNHCAFDDFVDVNEAPTTPPKIDKAAVLRNDVFLDRRQQGCESQTWYLEPRDLTPRFEAVADCVDRVPDDPAKTRERGLPPIHANSASAEPSASDSGAKRATGPPGSVPTRGRTDGDPLWQSLEHTSSQSQGTENQKVSTVSAVRKPMKRPAAATQAPKKESGRGRGRAAGRGSADQRGRGGRGCKASRKGEDLTSSPRVLVRPAARVPAAKRGRGRGSR
ncbi:hisS [Symbiodinium microadriaticum]|nr:hisS [Symbiodinium microadriaticum]